MTDPGAPIRRGRATGRDATGGADAPGGNPSTAPAPTGRRRRPRALWPRGALAVGIVALCTMLVVGIVTTVGSPAPKRHAAAPTTTSTTTSSTTTTTLAPTTTTSPPTTTTSTAPAATPPDPIAALPGVGSSNQVITVTTAGYGTDVARVTAYARQGGRFVRVFGPWQGFVGTAGLAPPGQKHEGDNRTPSGTYGFGTFFGIYANPGVQYPYLRVTGPNDVWNDDPSSPNYNHWVDTSAQGAVPGANPENMDNAPSYHYGALIDYNTGPVVRGAGSAIFFHVSDGGGTAGCVSIPEGDLVPVLQWLVPAQSPQIVIGTASSLGIT